MHTIELQMRKQVDICISMFSHVCQSTQANGGIRFFTRHLITVAAIHHNHRILAHQIASGELVSTVITSNDAGEVSVRLLERTSIRKFIEIHSRALQERPLLRVTRQRIKSNRNTFRISFKRISGQTNIQVNHHRRIATNNRHRGIGLFGHGTARTRLAVFTIIHHANAVAVTDNLYPALVLKFFCLAREVYITCRRDNPLTIHTDTRRTIVFYEDNVALIIIRTLRKVVDGGNDIHTHLTNIFDRVSARHKKQSSADKG